MTTVSPYSLPQDLTEMATVAVLPTSDPSKFEHALATIEHWTKAEPTDDEKLEFLEKAIKDLGQPGNVEIFRNAMKELGKRAVKINDTFYNVWMTMANILAYHKDEYPGLHPYFEEWDEHRRVGLRFYLLSLPNEHLFSDLVQVSRHVPKSRFPN